MYFKQKNPTRLKMEDDKNIGKHIHVFRTILDELIIVAATIDVDEKIEFLLESIYDSYWNFVDILNNTKAITLQTAMQDFSKKN